MPFSAIKAIKWAGKKDYKVFLATGRSKCEIFDYILDIGFDGIVGAAGGYVEVEEIQKVIDFYGGNIEDTIAIGDRDNDIEMLNFANIGIDMGNSSKSLLKYADFIAADVENNGLSSAICKFLI